MYKKLIDDAEKLLCDDIIFQGNGEPFLDDRLFEMAGYARDKGLKVIIFTNGILLDQANIKRLHELEVSEIFCSLPAGMARTYSLINPGHPGDTFDRVVTNLKELISERGIPTTEIVLKGDSLLTKLFTAVHIGDFVSYFLAVNNGVDPVETNVQEELKKRLSKIK